MTNNPITKGQSIWNPEMQFLLLILGLLVSILLWKISCRSFHGHLADMLRLLFVAIFTAGVPFFDEGYILFWLYLFSKDLVNPLSILLLISIYWVAYSAIYFWIVWLLKELGIIGKE